MTGDCHVRFLESVGVKSPCATYPYVHFEMFTDYSVYHHRRLILDRLCFCGISGNLLNLSI